MNYANQDTITMIKFEIPIQNYYFDSYFKDISINFKIIAKYFGEQVGILVVYIFSIIPER